MSLWPIGFTTAGVAAATATWAAVHPASQIFGRTLRHTSSPSRIALTFDDGPNPAITPQILQLLERHSVRATFFLIGKYARASPGLVREIAARRHVIGNHTETHPNLALLSARRIEDEVRRCQANIVAALPTGAAAPAWVRPPFGYRGPQLGTAVQRAGLRGVAMWSLTCHDW
jgi:peptidoglycan/xylan/chitin deacetylase (PgdA/CDA1 family)